MENPLKVSLENIIPLTEARDHFSQIVAEVQKDKLYVLTKGGKPAVAIIDVKYLETISGGEIKEENIEKEIEKAPEKVGLPPMVEHKVATSDQPRPIPKPAGFAAPQPPKPAPPPKPEPPKPAGFAAPQPAKAEPPAPPPPKPASTPPPPPPKPAEPKPAPNPPPTTGGPLKTPPLENPKEKSSINVSINPDSDEQAKAKAEDERTIYGGDEDEPGPAQYSGGSNDLGGQKDTGEPEDMVID